MPHGHKWSYDDQDECGPNKWSKYYRTGEHQSPINILVDAHRVSHQAVTCCAGRLKESLKLVTNDNIEIKARDLRQQHRPVYRRHLDSIGEDSQANNNDNSSNNSNSSSPSGSASSSASSSNRSSPMQAESSGDFFDDDVDFNNIADNNNIDDGYSGQNDKSSRRKCSKKNLTIKLRQNSRFCISNKKIFLGYPRYLNSMELQNTGHSWQVSLPEELSAHTRKFNNIIHFQSNFGLFYR